MKQIRNVLSRRLKNAAAHLLRDWYNAMCDDELEAEREEEAERGQLNETLLTNELTALAKKLKLSEMARIDAEDEARQYRIRAEDLEQELEESRRELAAMTAEAQEETRKGVDPVKQRDRTTAKMVKLEAEAREREKIIAELIAAQKETEREAQREKARASKVGELEEAYRALKKEADAMREALFVSEEERAKLHRHSLNHVENVAPPHPQLGTVLSELAQSRHQVRQLQTSYNEAQAEVERIRDEASEMKGTVGDLQGAMGSLAQEVSQAVRTAHNVIAEPTQSARDMELEQLVKSVVTRISSSFQVYLLWNWRSKARRWNREGPLQGEALRASLSEDVDALRNALRLSAQESDPQSVPQHQKLGRSSPPPGPLPFWGSRSSAEFSEYHPTPSQGPLEGLLRTSADKRASVAPRQEPQLSGMVQTLNKQVASLRDQLHLHPIPAYVGVSEQQGNNCRGPTTAMPISTAIDDPPDVTPVHEQHLKAVQERKGQLLATRAKLVQKAKDAAAQLASPTRGPAIRYQQL